MAKTKPHKREEQKLHRLGHRLVAGVDEAGRGAWAGPIVAGAVILDETFEPKLVNDSKQLTAKQREKMFVHISHHAVSWAVGVIPHTTIDRDGMTAANRLALTTALERLHVQPDAVLVDAMPISYKKKPVTAIIDGDAKSLTIAAASIVAKVVRDALMDGEHRRYPEYGFAEHKGYGTAAHEKALAAHGPSPIHRQSFEPLKRAVATAKGKKIVRRAAPRRVAKKK